jgi:predicted hotdog family 3-hydroxylacyl-ACP dehydratase
VSAYPPIEELVPHAGAMVLLEELLEHSPGQARCRLRVREGAPFVRDGAVQSAVTIEYMAQAVAACLGYEALLGGAGVRVGMIIGCKRFEAHAEALQVGDEVEVHVQCVQGNDALSHFEGKVLRGDSVFSEALLTLFHAQELPGARS